MNYFTSIEFTSGTYTGVAYNAANNTVIYRTKPYTDQNQALADVNNYIKSQNGNNLAAGQTIVNRAVTIEPVNNATAQPVRKCCGRS